MWLSAIIFGNDNLFLLTELNVLLFPDTDQNRLAYAKGAMMADGREVQVQRFGFQGPRK
jgi:hypothetical protein